jgi:antibiotic biosynthesis monooxygenase (ABM) superfamily enzyme
MQPIVRAGIRSTGMVAIYLMVMIATWVLGAHGALTNIARWVLFGILLFGCIAWWRLVPAWLDRRHSQRRTDLSGPDSS